MRVVRPDGARPSAGAALLVVLALPAVALAQPSTLLYGVEMEAGLADPGAIAVAVEAAASGASMTPARDPLLDAAPSDAVLLQYVAARPDAAAATLRVRSLAGSLAIEVAVAQQVVLRRYQASERAALVTSVRDVVRLALDAMRDLLVSGAERTAGPPRVAIVIDDPGARAAFEAPLASALASSAMIVPSSIVAAARAFLPRDSDPAQNTTTLRDRLDADRVILVVPEGGVTHFYVVDRDATYTRDLPAGATPSDAAAVLASMPAAARRPPLRVASRVAARAEAASASGGEGGGADVEPEEHVWLAATGREYRWVRVAHLGFAGAIGFSEGGGALGGFSVSENFPLYPVVNTDTFALPINLSAQVHFLFGEAGGAFVGAIPVAIFGAGLGVQTRWLWAEVHGGGGFVPFVTGGGGRANVQVVGVGNVGFRAGTPLLEHGFAEPHDQLSLFGGLDFLFGDRGWYGITSIGVSL